MNLMTGFISVVADLSMALAELHVLSVTSVHFMRISSDRKTENSA